MRLEVKTMREFSYTLNGEKGLHARGAGQLVQEAQSFNSSISIVYNDRIENLKRLFAVTCLGAKKGDFVTVRAQGSDENEAAAALQRYFRENL